MPVVNHVWGSAVAVAVNLHLLAAMPDMPGGLHPRPPMLEYDTTPNLFREQLSAEPLNIDAEVRKDGCAPVPEAPGIGLTPDPDFIKKYKNGIARINARRSIDIKLNCAAAPQTSIAKDLDGGRRLGVGRRENERGRPRARVFFCRRKTSKKCGGWRAAPTLSN